MNEQLNNYMRSLSTSQRIMQDILTIVNSQETTLSTLINNETQNELISLRRENQELIRTVRMLRERERGSRDPQPRNYFDVRRESQPIVPPLWNQRNNYQTTQPLLNDRNRGIFNTPRNRVPNNHQNFMRNYFQGLPNLVVNNPEDQIDMTPVIIRPSDRQLRQATQLVRFGTINDPQNTRCPITLANFTDQDLVTRIIFCGHIFSTEALQTWFESNVRCPMCRFDIREHRNRYINSASLHSVNVLNTVQEEDNDEENNEENIDNDEENQINNEENDEVLRENEDNDDDYNFDNFVSDSVDALVNEQHSGISVTTSFQTVPFTNTSLLDVFNDISNNLGSVTNGRVNFIQRYISDPSFNNII